MDDMELYEITIIDNSGLLSYSKETMLFRANDFAHAEEQAVEALELAGQTEHTEIVAIHKDFDNVSE